MGGCTRVHRGRWGRDGWHRVTGGEGRGHRDNEHRSGVRTRVKGKGDKEERSRERRKGDNEMETNT